MSLEEKMAALTAALEANTAALQGKASSAGKTTAAAGTGKTTAGKGAASGSGKKAVSVEQAQAAITKIKDDYSLDEARKVLKACKLAKLADVSDENAEQVLKAATKHYDALSAGGDEEEQEDDGEI